MYTKNRRFEWDENKARTNFLKHGIQFAEATAAFDDINALVEADQSHSQDEPRQRLVGARPSGHLIAVIFTIRSGASIRIISARTAKRRERKVYERR
jgi:uncharacterized DUF497 family protein